MNPTDPRTTLAAVQSSPVIEALDKGASLLGLFITLNTETGFATIVVAHVMFSDDHGKTWQLGGDLERPAEAEARLDRDDEDVDQFRQLVVDLREPAPRPVSDRRHRSDPARDD